MKLTLSRANRLCSSRETSRSQRTGIRHLMSSKRSGERNGAALVELAMCLPVFLLTIIGIIEFGRAMSVAQMLNAAAREGCRLAIVDDSTNSAVQAAVVDLVTKTVGCPAGSVNVTIAVTVDSTNTARSDLSVATYRDVVTVTVSVPHSVVSYSFNRWLEGTTLKGKCAMRHE